MCFIVCLVFSGPSLEIISDTEWLSEGETSVKKEGSKNSKNSKKLKKKKQESKTKLKSKEKGGEKKSGVKVKLEKVKTERKDKDKDKKKDKEKDKSKEKEKEKGKEKDKDKEKEKKQLPKEGTGSLLDLLELEMRARAIRALIRKEEDSSTSKNKTGKDSSNDVAEASTSNDNGSKARQASLKEQLEKIDVLMKHGEEDDIYVVINPAPTIDLLSSDSENESSTKRGNKKLVSEKETVSQLQLEKDIISSKQVETPIKLPVLNGEKDDEIESSNKPEEQKTESKKKEADKNQTESLNLPMTATEISENEEKSTTPKEKTPPEELEDGEIIEDESEKSTEPTPSTSDANIKKVKKNPNLRLKKKHKESSDDEKSIEADSSSKKEADSQLNLEKPIEIEDSPERQVSKEPEPRKSELIKVPPADDFDDDKTLDIEEIINLDDYPDDEADEAAPSKEQPPQPPTEKTDNNDNSLEKDQAMLDSETWASRYIQQDGVQNVIKESKIQSEIRKRLRERQRQNKLNNSPKLDELSQESSSQDAIAEKPTGSVEEYLALKGITKDSSNESSELIKTEDVPETEQATPVVIVKKPQLNVKILSIEKIDPVTQIFAVERLNEIVKTGESVFKNSEESVKEEVVEPVKIETEPVCTPETVEDVQTNIEESVPIGSSSPKKEIKDEPPNLDESTQSLEEKNSSFSRDDEFTTSRSDSSDDNIIVKIDNISTSDRRLEDQ